MIKKLQRKFIVIATLSVFAVMLVIVGGINLANLYSTNRQIDLLLALLADNEGRFPPYDFDDDDDKLYPNEAALAGLSEESRFMTRYFVARVDFQGKIFQLDTSHIAALSSSGAQKLAQKALANERSSGYIDVYKYLVTGKPYGKLIVFLDCRERLAAVGRVLGASLAIGISGLAVVFLLISVFSSRVVKPVAESIEKQRRFITDASHEIKTPLAIVAANVEVLTYTYGDSEWTKSIKNQIKRLGELIDDLLVLSRLDEQNQSMPGKVFSLSLLAEEIAEPYRAVALAKGLNFELYISPKIGCRGDEAGIRRLVSALLDNAFKYAGGERRVSVKLAKRGRWAVLEVFNTVDEPGSFNDEELGRIFDRFYRSDLSRARETGGYGLGLSIAKSIAESNHGTIAAKRRDGGLAFVVTLPFASVQP